MLLVRALGKGLARWRIGNPAIAAHSIRLGGTIAGRIDHCEGGAIRGWVYDAAHPDDVLSLDICIDGLPLVRIRADAFRADLAQILGDGGRHGFAGTWDTALVSRDASFLSVRVVDRPQYVVGEIPLRAETARGATDDATDDATVIEPGDIEAHLDAYRGDKLSGRIILAKRSPRSVALDVFCNGLFVGSKQAHLSNESANGAERTYAFDVQVDRSRFEDSDHTLAFQVYLTSPTIHFVGDLVTHA